MFKCKIFVLLAAFIFFFSIHLLADIIVTNDDMILNGKILEEKKEEYVKFGNYHGIFTIDYRQIKEIHRTERYEDDVKILKGKGKSVDETEVKTNYQAGLEKLEEQENAGEKAKKEEIRTADFILLFSPFFNINMGKLNNVLPYSFGGSVTLDAPLDRFQRLKEIFLTGFRIEADYFYSQKGAERIFGFRASAGPLWRFPFSIGAFDCNYGISPVIGLGWYSVSGKTEKRNAVKWNVALITGPVFNIYSIVLSLQIKFDYIYDRRAPLYGIGCAVGVGFRL